MNHLTFKIGELLVRHGKVLKVSQLTPDHMELKPFFNLKSSNDLTYTVELGNIKNSIVRRLVTKTELASLLKTIFSQPIKLPEFNADEAKTGLNNNLLAETLKLIKLLWLEKQAKGSILPGGKLNIYQQALAQAGDEIAAVKNISPEDAKTLILSTLKTHNQPSE